MCGGYNPKGWIGLGEDRDAIAAFLFTWPDGDTSRRPIKLQKARFRLRLWSLCCLPNPSDDPCPVMPYCSIGWPGSSTRLLTPKLLYAWS